jgi:hypothetical protein
MASARILVFVLLGSLLTSCIHKSKPGDSSMQIETSGTPGPPLSSLGEAKALPAAKRTSSDSLQPAVDKVPLFQTSDRKIIRNAEISLEMRSPGEAQPKIAALAEKHHGFVVTSEFRQNGSRSMTLSPTVVTIVIRVPAQEFDAVIEEIRSAGGRVLDDKRSGQDVTEEYVDLEARLRAKRALEMQLLDIMKQAHKVTDALEVQTQLGEVRTEIEQFEGRRRFLENQSALSTIKVTLSAPLPVVVATTHSFVADVKAALGDGVDTGADIVLGIIRFGIVMIPVTLFILLPAWFALKWLLRQVRWPRPAPPVVGTGD